MSQNVHSEIINHVFSIHMPAMQLFRIIGGMSADTSILSLDGADREMICWENESEINEIYKILNGWPITDT